MGSRAHLFLQRLEAAGEIMLARLSPRESEWLRVCGVSGAVQLSKEHGKQEHDQPYPPAPVLITVEAPVKPERSISKPPRREEKAMTGQREYWIREDISREARQALDAGARRQHENELQTMLAKVKSVEPEAYGARRPGELPWLAKCARLGLIEHADTLPNPSNYPGAQDLFLWRLTPDGRERLAGIATGE